MKITHPSGQPYDLFPDTEIELVKYNPFFHELGEQSLPISIPATSKNLQMLGYPERADNVNKPTSRLDAHLQSGVYAVVGRQAILSVQEAGTIETSFYLHEGAFYAKIENVTLAEIFENKKIAFSGIQNAINFMYSLVPGTDERFAVFPVMTDNYTLNDLRTDKTSEGYYRFKNEFETTDTIDGKSVSVPKGFHITPFIKVKHLLTEVLNYLGYTLAPSLLDQPPFKNMVFVNDNLDTIVSNSINYVDVVPNIDVKTLFNVIRKFNIEFIPDEVNRVIYLLPFGTILNSPVTFDFTNHAIFHPTVSYHHDYKQLRLKSEQLSLPSQLSFLSWTGRRYDTSTGVSEESEINLSEVLSRFPTSYLRRNDGYIVRDGFKADRRFSEKIIHLGADFFAGGSLTVDEHSFPDQVIPMHTVRSTSPSGTVSYTVTPYVGTGRALQSKVVFSDVESDGEIADKSELKPMLCLFYSQVTNCRGTTYNYDQAGNKLWDYSIMWNGPDGIYEKFWRSRDALTRNALLEIEFEALLSEENKMSLSSTGKVALNNQIYLLSEINYSTKRRSIATCRLLSTKLQAPVSESPPAENYYRLKTYQWNPKSSRSWSSIPGQPTTYRFISEPIALYPPDPTSAQYNAGGRYHEKTYDVEYGRVDDRTGEFQKLGDGRLTVWLEPALYQ